MLFRSIQVGLHYWACLFVYYGLLLFWNICLRITERLALDYPTQTQV